MSDGSVTLNAVRAVARLSAAALETLTTGPDGLAELAEELRFDVDAAALPSGAALQAAAQSLTAAGSSTAPEADGWAALAAAFAEAAKAASGVVQALAVLDPAAVVPEPEQVLKIALVHGLEDRHPALLLALAALGLMRVRLEMAEKTVEGFEVSTRRVLLDPDPAAIGRLFSDPVAHLREAHGWGGANLSAEALFELAQHVLPGAPTEPMIGLAKSLWTGPVRWSVDRGTVPPGLEAALSIERGGPVETTRDSDSGLRAALSGKASGAGRMALTIRPPFDVTVGGDGALALTVNLLLTRGVPDPLPLLEAGPISASVRAPHLDLRLSAKTGSSFDASVGGALDGLRIVVGPEEPDGFLKMILPSSGLDFETDLSAAWSPKGGLSLDGLGLEVDVPLAVELGGVLRLTLARLAVGTEGGVVSLSVRINGAARLGPLDVAVSGIGAALALGGAEGQILARLGGADLRLSPLPPAGIGLALDLSVVRGGGFLSVEPGRYAGALELAAGELALAAFGMVETRMPDGRDGFSMLLFVSGQFAPVQLGFGFTLLGVGGLLGVHRDVDPNALMAAVRSGTAGDLLSPEDPVRDAARLIDLAESIFPAKRGQYVFGPTAKLGWGTPTLLSLDVALAVTLPEPLRIVLIGRLVGAIPAPEAPILKVNIDVAGVLDLSASSLAVEGRLHDSSIQLIPVEGGFAIRSSWSGPRNLVFSIGGLHPAFEPPPSFPDLPRMGTNLSKGRLLKLTLGGYFAMTPNTIQIGAKVELRVSAEGFTLLGELGFDALIEFEPFRMQVDIQARVQVMRGRRSLMKLTFRGRLSGPNPWHVRGHAIVEVPFLPDVKVGASAIFGTAHVLPSEPVNVLKLIADSLGRMTAWRSDGPPKGLVLASGAGRLIDPRGEVRLLQEVAPLGRRWDTFYGKPVAGATSAWIGSVTAGGRPLDVLGRLDAPFPPAAFRILDEATRVSAPGFQDLEAGARMGGVAAAASGSTAPKDQTRETVVLGPRTATVGIAAPRVAPHLQPVARAKPAPSSLIVSVHEESWRATNRDGQPRGSPTDWLSAHDEDGGAPILDAEAA